MGYAGKIWEQARARELRVHGLTLQAIAEDLGVSKGSVSAWVRDVPFIPGPRQASRQRGPNVLQRRKQTEIEAGLDWGRSQIGELTDRDLLIAGAALYAGEGAKRDGSVKFTNTDPRQIALFCRWLRHIVDVDERRLRVSLHLHDGLDLERAVNHWAEIANIPPSQFTAPHRARPSGGRKATKHVNGCASVVYNCSLTHRRVMGLVRALLAQVEG